MRRWFRAIQLAFIVIDALDRMRAVTPMRRRIFSRRGILSRLLRRIT